MTASSVVSELRPIEIGVQPTSGQQLGVRPTLNDLAIFDHEDLVGATDRGQSVRDDDGGAPDQSIIQGLLHSHLGLTVEMSGRLVEH